MTNVRRGRHPGENFCCTAASWEKGMKGLKAHVLADKRFKTNFYKRYVLRKAEDGTWVIYWRAMTRKGTS